MGATYTRQSSSTIVDGATIEAAHFNLEFDQLVAAFAITTGHSHDGTAAEGGPVTKLLGTAITIGDGTAGTDIAVTFDGESSNGVLTWMEDEDHFKFSDDVVLDSSKRLYLYDEGGEYIYGDGTDLYLVSGADINIPASIGLTFGDDGEKIEGDGTDLTISASALFNVDAGTDIVLDAGGGDIFFKDDGTTFGSATNTSGNLIIKSGTTTALTFSGANVTGAGTYTGGGLMTTGGNIVIPNAGNIGSASDTDAIAISSGGVVTFSQNPVFPDGGVPIADLDIDGGTDIGEAIVDADLFIVDNGAGGTNRKTAASRIKTYIGAADLTSIGSNLVPDGSGTRDIGTASAEWGDVYVADDKYIQFGSDQNVIVGYDENGNDTLEFKANVEAAALGLTFSADQADDNADTWKLNFADGGIITWQSYTSGSFVTKQTLDTSGNLTLTGAIELGHASDTTVARSGSGDITIEGNAIYRAGGTDVPVADGGTGASSLTDGGVLLGSGTGAVTAMAVLANGEMIVGDGSTDPVPESGSTLRTSIGLGTFAVENVNAVPALTLAAAITGADQTVSAINLKDYGEVTNAIGATGGGTQDIDLNAGNNVVATVDTNTNTFTFSNPTASDELCGFTLFLTNGGSQTVNWPGTVDWAGGTAPTLTTSGLDILVFVTTDGGTIWHGMVGSADSK